MIKKSFLSKSLMALLLAASIFNASALPAKAEPRYDTNEMVQYGATGYPIVIQSQYRDGFLQPYQEEQAARDPAIAHLLGNTGLYEYNGQVIYLTSSKQPKVALVTYYYRNSDGMSTSCTLYCDSQGHIREYTEESRAAIDAEIAEHLARLEAELQTQYGISLSHRKTFSIDERYEFANTVKDLLADYPPGSVRIIADASQAATGKPLKFQSIYIDSNGITNAGMGVMGTYSSDSNIVQTNGWLIETAHELGHAMESPLNKASGGKLRQDFAETFSDAMNFTTTELQAAVNRGTMAAEYFQKVVYVKQLFNQYAGTTVLQ